MAVSRAEESTLFVTKEKLVFGKLQLFIKSYFNWKTKLYIIRKDFSLLILVSILLHLIAFFNFNCKLQAISSRSP